MRRAAVWAGPEAEPRALRREAAEAAQRLAAKTVAGRSEGPRAQKRSKALRMAIIAVEYNKYAEGEQNALRRRSAKTAATEILERVNVAFDHQKLGSLTVLTLEKRLRSIINAV